MTMKSPFWAVMILALCCCPLFARAQTDPNSWEKLNLSSTSIAGATVHYEKSFEPKLPFFEKEYKKFLAEKEKGKVISYKKDQIIADINHILGISEPDFEMQNRLWTWFIGVFSIEKTIFYVVKQGTIKDFLRAGGQLPNFTYDKSNDIAAYKPEFKTTSKDGPIKDLEFTFPIASDETFEKNVRLMFQILRDAFDRVSLFVTIHEVTEASLLMYAKPTDPYWRWFSDGFANAITYELLKKHADDRIAEEFLACHDVNDYKDLEKEINLQYWMSFQYCVLQRTPVEYENKLTNARYAYATVESQRLIKKYGMDCVKKILDEVRKKNSRTGEDLLLAIKSVTGEKMQQRLSRYQSFNTREEVIPKYATLFNAASKKKDYAQMFINLLRIMELRPMPFSPTQLRDFKEAALLLFKLGYEQAGDEVMLNCMQLFEESPIPDGRQAAMETFIIYALECNNPRKAEKIAEQMLRDKPNHAVSLVVKMLMHAETGELSDAKKIARKIQSLAKVEKDKRSLSYKAASRILAIDPNQPAADKEPSR